MKGLKIEKAKPSNAIDIFALLSQGQKEGLLPGKPSERQLKSYYFGRLLSDLGAPGHLWVMAKRGRGYLGFAHAKVQPGIWDAQVSSVTIDLIFVVPNRRKNGIGRKLLDEIVKEVENLGIKRIEFVCPPEQVEYWQKARKATVVKVGMGVNL